VQSNLALAALVLAEFPQYERRSVEERFGLSARALFHYINGSKHLCEHGLSAAAQVFSHHRAGDPSLSRQDFAARFKITAQTLDKWINEDGALTGTGRYSQQSFQAHAAKSQPQQHLTQQSLPNLEETDWAARYAPVQSKLALAALVLAEYPQYERRSVEAQFDVSPKTLYQYINGSKQLCEHGLPAAAQVFSHRRAGDPGLSRQDFAARFNITSQALDKWVNEDGTLTGMGRDSQQRSQAHAAKSQPQQHLARQSENLPNLEETDWAARYAPVQSNLALAALVLAELPQYERRSVEAQFGVSPCVF
jgi:DNA-binding transcriptional regulator YiaG